MQQWLRAKGNDSLGDQGMGFPSTFNWQIAIKKSLGDLYPAGLEFESGSGVGVGDLTLSTRKGAWLSGSAPRFSPGISI